MQCIPVILLSAVIIGAILCSACIDPSGPPKTVYTPNVSQTELRVDYTGPVSANYGTYDCIAREEVTAPVGAPIFNIQLPHGLCLLRESEE